MNENNQESPPKYLGPNLPEMELEVLKFWQENKLFDKSLQNTQGKDSFIFYDGPPFATGTPHYGSILPSVIKDAIPRYKTMQGMYVRRRWGWDCHGLPIENIVEQKLGISGKKQIEEIGIEKFNALCRENVLTYTHEWGKTIERIARWVEFENSYKTMDTSFMESVWWGLKQIWDKGLIYEDNKVLMYCSRCETPVSNFEVAMDNSYKDVTEVSVFAKFKLQERQRIVDYIIDDKTFVLAWTTTPWTLPGNTALNIGADIIYVLVSQNNEHYILAKDRLEILEGEYEILQEFSARSLEGLIYHPLYEGVIANPDSTAHKIYIEDYVTTTDGTGIVHNAAMYGEVDYVAAKARNLPKQHILDQKGQYVETMPSNLKGLFFKDADKVVLQELQAKGLVYKLHNYTHSYPHCWRCGTPLYYSALPAWFINIQKIKSKLLTLNEDVTWYPEHLKHGRFQKGIENAPDWNISRNRYWATALPFWKCDSSACGNLACIGSVEELKTKSPNFDEVYPGYNSAEIEKLDLHKPFVDKVKLRCESCGGFMTRVPEVVDCWVESGSMPFAELHYPFENQDLFAKRFPSDFVVEYIPQTRAWFYVMHVLSTIIFDKAPFKNVVTTGTILAEDGSKMSKSKKNYPDPSLILDKYGADALRFYLLSSPVITGEDLNFSEKGVAEVNRKLSIILYNVWQFFRMYSNEKAVTEIPQSTSELDRWVLAYLAQTTKLVTKYLDSYNTVKACRELQEFVTEFSTWYVRRSRDRIKQGGEVGKTSLDVLGYVLTQVSKLLAPLMPFLSEQIYRDLTSDLSVHLASWPMVTEPEEVLLEQMNLLRKIVELGLSLRKEQNLKVRQPLATLYLGSENTLPEALLSILQEELNVKNIIQSRLQEFDADRSGLVQKTDGELIVGLDTVLTPELELEGLGREIERQIQDLRKKSGLKVGQGITLYYNSTDTGVVEALLKLVDRQKTFIKDIATNPEIEADFEAQVTVNSKPLWLGIVL